MKSFFWAALLVAVISTECGAAPAAPASPTSPTSPAMEGLSAQKSWAAAVRMGDASARWPLAWAYAGAGDLPKAWQWVREEPVAGDAERGYFKAWLNWRLGRAAQVGLILDESGCEQVRCRLLRLNALWDQEEWGAARDTAGLWIPANGRASPEVLHLALLATFLAGDLQKFDALFPRNDWRSLPEFNVVREELRALEKLRSNF